MNKNYGELDCPKGHGHMVFIEKGCPKSGSEYCDICNIKEKECHKSE